jgi:hypothetical protein
MSKRRSRILLCILVVLGLGAVAASVEPTGTVRAFIAGEPFYHLRPLRHWREVLRQCGQQRDIPPRTRGLFWDWTKAHPVLRACAKDPDANVRWPAVYVLGFQGEGSAEDLGTLTEALGDEALDVRFQAVLALTTWGPKARPAGTALADRLRDSDTRVAHMADIALWQVDPAGAPATCGWRLFRSPQWKFSVMLPGEPEASEEREPLSGLPIHAFQSWHKVGSEIIPVRYFAAVTDYPKQVMRTTEKERLDASRDAVPLGLTHFGMSGKVRSERAVEQGGLTGRDYIVDVGGGGLLRRRLFWRGTRLYNVGFATGKILKYFNERAAEFYLDSFRVDAAAEDKAPAAQPVPPKR